MHRPRVYADTNVLYPYYLSDLLLWLSSDGAVRLLRTGYLVEEVIEVVPRRRSVGKGRDEATVRGQWDAACKYLADDEVAEADWKAVLPELRGPDPDDLPHAAAAIAGRADVLLTANLKHFPRRQLAERGVRLMGADAFLCELIADDPEQVALTVAKILGRYRRPPLSPQRYVAIMGRTVPGLAERLAVLLGQPFPWRLRLRLATRRIRVRLARRVRTSMVR